jgi:hypothetical protein
MTVIASELNSNILSPRDVAGYKSDPKQPLFKRLAEFLQWAAVKHPKKISPWNVATKAVMGYDRTPSMTFKEVAHLRSTSSRARLFLMDKYQRDVVCIVGVGVRASAGDEDTYKTGMVKRARVLDRAALGVERTAAIIDIKNLSPESRAGMSIILGVCKGLPALRERLMLSAGKASDAGKKP